MNVRYLGHSSFWVASQKGSSAILDPYSQRMPYTLPPLEPDVVLVSHEHHDHNAYYRFNNNPMLLKRTHDFPMESEINIEKTGEKLTFYGLPTYHDDQLGRKRGPNTVWHWFWEGIHFAHFGDIGHLLTDEQLNALGKVDVVFLPVGGKETLDPSTATIFVQQLDPRIVFPMHYHTEELGESPLCEFPLSAFADKMNNVDDAGTMAVEIELARLPAQTKVICLKHG
jgi:L-ascorbate metabolism protein UlaG (beta-lactamase superfamily)